MKLLINYFSAIKSHPRLFLAITGGLLIVAAAILSYQQALNHAFLSWDDYLYVYQNAQIKALDPSHLYWMATTFHASNWHPLTWLSHALDYAIWGLNPWGHHLTNILLHLANSLLVMLLTILLIAAASRRSVGDQSPLQVTKQILLAGAASGLLFAIHPQHVEVVAWVAERKELLCLFFYLLCLISYIFYVLDRRRLWRNLALLCCALALAAKPMAVSLPLVLLLLDAYPLNRMTLGRWREMTGLLWEKSGFFLLSFAAMLLTLMAQGQWGSIKSFDEVDLTQRLLNAANSLVFYLQKWLLPQALSPFYPYPDWIRELDWRALLPVLAVTAITLLAIREWMIGRRFWLIAWLYYVITLAPVLGIVQVGAQAAADRYAYLPTLSFYVLVGAGVGWLLATRWRWPALTVGLLMVVILIALTRSQTAVWRNDATLWTSVIRYYPNRVPIAYHNLANVAFNEGQYAQAVDLAHKALEIDPDYPAARLNLGFFNERLGNFEQALYQYERLLSEGFDKVAVLIRMGDLRRRRGQHDEAQWLYREALRIAPDRVDALYGLALIDHALKRFDQAETTLQQALVLTPDYADAILLLAMLQHRRGEWVLAKAGYRQVLSLRPDNFAARHNLDALERMNP